VATLSSPSVLLASDSGSLLLLHVGERFVLLLGQYTGTDWSVQLSDPSVLQRVGDDGQGLYQASTPGETELTAIGDPACLRARPACGAPSRVSDGNTSAGCKSAMLWACLNCSGSCSRPSWPGYARARISCSRTCCYGTSLPS
jgi:hypothetical protein